MSPSIITKPKIEIDAKLLEEIKTVTFEAGQVVVHCIHRNQSKTLSFIRIWPSTNLYDHYSSHCSDLIMAENISYFPDWTIAPPGRSFFSLIFNGLPKSCKIFDLIEDCKGGPFPFKVLNLKRNDTDVYFVEI